jgi:hypothetical protein
VGVSSDYTTYGGEVKIFGFGESGISPSFFSSFLIKKLEKQKAPGKYFRGLLFEWSFNIHWKAGPLW